MKPLEQPVQHVIDYKINKLVQYTETVKQKYPDAVARVQQYHRDYESKKFLSTLNRDTAGEILDVYTAAINSGYNPNAHEQHLDTKITFVATIIKDSTILEDIARRIESDDIVDIDGNKA